MSGWILSSNARTSRSLRAFLDSNGSASDESKFGSPEPGTRMLDSPDEWPSVSASWKGVKRMEVIGREEVEGRGWVR